MHSSANYNLLCLCIIPFLGLPPHSTACALHVPSQAQISALTPAFCKCYFSIISSYSASPSLSMDVRIRHELKEFVFQIILKSLMVMLFS